MPKPKKQYKITSTSWRTTRINMYFTLIECFGEKGGKEIHNIIKEQIHEEGFKMESDIGLKRYMEIAVQF